MEDKRYYKVARLLAKTPVATYNFKQRGVWKKIAEIIRQTDDWHTLERIGNDLDHWNHEHWERNDWFLDGFGDQPGCHNCQSNCRLKQKAIEDLRRYS